MAGTVLRVGSNPILDSAARVLGSVQPAGSLSVTGLLGPSLADPQRAETAAVGGAVLADFFDKGGVSRVAGRAALIPAGDGGLEVRARNAVTAGASALLVYGTELPAGALDLEEATAIPVVALPEEEGRDALEALARGQAVSVSFGRVDRHLNRAADRVAPFSSGGVAFDGRVKPDVVAPGVGIATADPGLNPDGTPRFATATGSSVAAAVAAGSAALVTRARPGLTSGELRSLLVGSARQLTAGETPDPVTLQGAGAIDPAAAAAAEVAVAPVGLAFGRVDGGDWRVAQTVTVRNLSARQLEIDFGITRDDRGGPDLAFAAGPAHLSLGPGAAAEVTLVASGSVSVSGRAAGAFLVSPDGSRPSRLPWAVMFRSQKQEELLSAVALSHTKFKSSDSAPTVLAFRAGAIVSDVEGHALEPVELLVAELWKPGGKRLGVLARMRDLLPGRYAFGLTGRGPGGRELRPGDYTLRLEAHPVAGDFGAIPSRVDVPFTITR
jgi:Subtilase family